uniref:tRNA-synt_1c domain-containing protein n=1 Tax=Mesocestoides corti TaxID=53468 RepID=A0A5K3F4G6_MESCO
MQQPSCTVFDDIVFGQITFQNVEDEGDPIIMKSDGLPVYHFANIVDDHLMEISHVIRGSEWLTSVPKHLQLYAAFDWQPPQFAHLPLMLSSSGRKFSKRLADQEEVGFVANLRSAGYLPSALLTWLSATGGLFSCPSLDAASPTSSTVWSPDRRIDEMLDSFDLSALNRHHARVDPELLQVCGRSHFDRLVDEASKVTWHSSATASSSYLVNYLREYFSSPRRCSATTEPLMDLLNDEERLLEVLVLLKGRVCRLSDLTSTFGFLWHPPHLTQAVASSAAELRGALLKTAELLDSTKLVTDDQLKELLETTLKLTSMPKAQFLKHLRLCLTGCERGMPVHELVFLLSPKEAARRLRAACKYL